MYFAKHYDNYNHTSDIQMGIPSVENIVKNCPGQLYPVPQVIFYEDLLSDKAWQLF